MPPICEQGRCVKFLRGPIHEQGMCEVSSKWGPDSLEEDFMTATSGVKAKTVPWWRDLKEALKIM